MTENTFFSNEVISLEKSIDLTSTPVETKLEDLDEVYEINRCSKWIQTNNFQRVSPSICAPKLHIFNIFDL